MPTFDLEPHEWRSARKRAKEWQDYQSLTATGMVGGLIVAAVILFVRFYLLSG